MSYFFSLFSKRFGVLVDDFLPDVLLASALVAERKPIGSKPVDVDDEAAVVVGLLMRSAANSSIKINNHEENFKTCYLQGDTHDLMILCINRVVRKILRLYNR